MAQNEVEMSFLFFMPSTSHTCGKLLKNTDSNCTTNQKRVRHNCPAM